MQDKTNQKNLPETENNSSINRRNVKILFPLNSETSSQTEASEDASSADAPEVSEELSAKRAVRFTDAADTIFLTRRRVYLLSFVLMIVFTCIGLCLYLRETDKAPVLYNAFLKFEKTADLKNAFSACFSEILFALILFAFGLTAFAPLACVSFLSYYFLRYGYYSAVFFERMTSDGGSFLSAAGYYLLISLSVLAEIIYASEVWKFSGVSSEGISRAFKAENFLPYLIDLLIYLTVITTVSFFMILLI